MPSTYRVDLRKIDGEGDFPCPKCGTLISPNDETEDVYTVIDTVVGDDDCLESVVIRCNRCKSTISLDGFEALSGEGNSGVEVSEALPESKEGYRTCHAISLNGQRFGHLVVDYAQKEDVEVFKRLRNLHLAEPFRCTITVENSEAELTSEGLQGIARSLRRRFRGLRDRDMYIVEVENGRKNFLGRASNLKDLPLTLKT